MGLHFTEKLKQHFLNNLLRYRELVPDNDFYRLSDVALYVGSLSSYGSLPRSRFWWTRITSSLKTTAWEANRTDDQQELMFISTFFIKILNYVS